MGFETYNVSVLRTWLSDNKLNDIWWSYDDSKIVSGPFTLSHIIKFKSNTNKGNVYLIHDNNKDSGEWWILGKNDSLEEEDTVRFIIPNKKHLYSTNPWEKIFKK